MRSTPLIIGCLVGATLFVFGAPPAAAAGPITAAIRLDTPTVSTSESIVFDVTVKNAADNTPAKQAYVSITMTNANNAAVWQTTAGQELRTQTDGYVHVVVSPTKRGGATGALAISAVIQDQGRTATASATSTVTVTNSPAAASAATDTSSAEKKNNVITVIPELTLIPGLFEAGKAFTISPTSIADYIRIIFVVFIWVVGILATVMVVYGGVRWIAAAGNPSQIKEARSIVDNAIIGLIIALTSVLLLNVISPTLTTFRGLVPTDVKTIDFQLAQDIIEQTGDISACAKKKVGGNPVKICSPNYQGDSLMPDGTMGCDSSESLNDWINHYAKKYNVDATLVKSIILIESPPNPRGPDFIFSGPELGGGPGYGIGQFKVGMTKDTLDIVNGGFPPGCKRDELDSGDGQRLSQSCRKWLDKRTKGANLAGIPGIQGQVGMVTYYLSIFMRDKKCINGNLALAAGAYNQGQGGVGATYCSSRYLSKATPAELERIKSNTINYINKVKQVYPQTCANNVE